MPVKLLTKVVTVFDYAINSLAALAGGLVILIMLSITADVTGRKLLGYSITGVIEISQILLVFITFLGAAWLLKREGHVKLDVMVSRLNPRSQALLNTITSIVGIIICLTLAWYGAKVTWDHFQRGIYSAEVLALPTFLRYAAITIGSFLLSVQFIRGSYGYLRGWRSLTETKDGRGK